jgi:hypothetical protein
MKFLIGSRGLYFFMLVVFTTIALNFPQASYNADSNRSEFNKGYKNYLEDSNQDRVYVEQNGKSDSENAQEIFNNISKSKEYKTLIAKNRVNSKQLRKKWFLMIGIPWLMITVFMLNRRYIKKIDSIIGLIPLLFFVSIYF